MNFTPARERRKVLTTVEEREPTTEERRDPNTEDPRGSRPTSRISIGGIRHDIAARAASNLAFLGEVILIRNKMTIYRLVLISASFRQCGVTYEDEKVLKVPPPVHVSHDG